MKIVEKFVPVSGTVVFHFSTVLNYYLSAILQLVFTYSASKFRKSILLEHNYFLSKFSPKQYCLVLRFVFVTEGGVL